MIHAILIEEGEIVIKKLAILILSNYVFKFIPALLDTIPFYVGVRFFTKNLNVELYKEYQKRI